VPDEVVDVILQFGSAHLKLFDFLIDREIDFFLDTVNFVVKPMVFIEDAPEVVVGAFEAANDLAVLGELSQDRMMKVHGDNLLSWFCNRVRV
jgi:hypothetical protein